MLLNAHLYEAYDFESAWADCLHAWFSQLKDYSAQAEIGVVVPKDSWAIALKQSLLNSGISLWRVSWYTPGSLRRALLDEYSINKAIALREDLRFLLSLAAADLPSNKIAQSMLKEPELFLQHYDQLLGGGWSACDFPTQESQELAQRLAYYIELSGLQPVQSVDLDLSQKKAKSVLWDDLLVYGFSHKNWGAYPLLKAGLAHARKSTVCLLASGAGIAAETWQGSWEELLGPAHLCVGEAGYPKPMVPVAEAMEFPSVLDTHLVKANQPSLRIAYNFKDEVKAILAQIFTFLAEDNCGRLGIVFPSQSSALAREVGRHLNDCDIPHCDSIGFLGGETNAQRLLTAWIQWQIKPCWDHFKFFIHTLLFSENVESSVVIELESVFENAFRDLMHDDYEILLQLVFNQMLTKEARTFLDAWPLLPQQGTFQLFYEKTQEIVRQVGDEDLVQHLERRSCALAEHFKIQIDRASFLKWLREVCKPGGRLRSPKGKEPFARVHLVTADNVLGQPWSHVIVAGLTKKDWESDYLDSNLVSDEYLDRLNRSKVKTGSQGEGHSIVVSGYHYMLTQSDRKQLAQNIFRQIVALPAQQIAFTASLLSGQVGESDQLLSDWLIHAYWISVGVFLDKEEQLIVCKQTQKWIEGFQETKSNFISETVKQTAVAYAARREAGKAFGPYEFSFDKKPEGALSLSCKAWEEALQRPAAVWLKHVLKVNKQVCAKEVFQSHLALGTWVHDWLALGDGVRQKLSTDAWLAHVDCRSKGIRKNVETAYKQKGQKSPIWWEEIYEKAQRKAKSLVKSVNIDDKRCEYLLSEFDLPQRVFADISGTRIPLRGRIDLLWLMHEGSVHNNQAWVVDYKTGSQKPLTIKKLQQGEGLQVALYAIALKQLGCVEVLFSVVNPAGVLAEQLSLADLEAIDGVLGKMASIYKTGRLGQLGSLFDEYSFVQDYPLATLPIDPAILEKKWAFS